MPDDATKPNGQVDPAHIPALGYGSPLNPADPLQYLLKGMQQQIDELKDELRGVRGAIPEHDLLSLSGGVKIIGQITGAGYDANHWLWKFVLIDHTTGADVMGEQGDLIYGQCTVAGSDSGEVGMQGPMFLQVTDDGGISVTLAACGGSTDLIPVLVVWSGGSDGDASTYATWTYNIYDLSDTAHVTALTGSAIQPKCSRARILMCQVNKAATDSVGLAYKDASENYNLFDCQETVKQNTCSDGG